MAKGIQIMAGDTKCGSPLPYFVSPHTLLGIHYLALQWALHVGKLVVTCRCPVVYSAVCTGFLHLLTTHRNMTLVVEDDIKQQVKK